MNDNVASAFYHLAVADDPLTTSELAKRVFDPEGKDELRNADRKVRHYLDDAYEHLTVETERDGVKHFNVRDDRIWFGAGRMHVVTMGGDEVSVGFGSVLVYEDADGDPQVVDIGMADGEVDGGEAGGGEEPAGDGGV